ncbi:CRE-NHX-2 protein [Aphelenchoides avenae]|nr:CRE-NHX-2 protein [Aphelenchus avenae]
MLKPVANFLQVERKKIFEKGMIDTVYENALDHTMIGIELIMGKHGHNWLRSAFENFDHKYLKPALLKPSARANMDQSNIMRAASRLAEKDAMRLAEQMHRWYEENKSRAGSLSGTSLPPNGDVIHTEAVVETRVIVEADVERSSTLDRSSDSHREEDGDDHVILTRI